ncbi:MAG TPA: PorP/SprF family type IX secretion system membrane protein [Bacteroidales bacterium]
MRPVFIITFILLCHFITAQDLPVYSEYHLNKSLINPAIIGSESCTWFKGTDRHQWLGIDGAPQVQTFSVEASLTNKKTLLEYNKRTHGLGVYLYRDKNGAYQNLGGQISYAYHFYISREHETKLGMGLSFQLLQSSLNEGVFKNDAGTTVNDPLVSGGLTSVLTPNAGAGLFVYNSKFYTGLSAANLLPFYKPLNGSISRNYFLIAGYLSGNEKDKIRVLPSFVLKTTEDLRKQIDLNLKLLMDESWWLALSYRHNLDNMPGVPVSIIPMVGINKGNFGFAYALNITPGSIQLYNYGTHEFMVSYHFCRDGFRCPVYR